MTQIIPNTQAVPQVIGSTQVVVNGTDHQWLANEIMHGIKVLHVGDYSFSAEEAGGSTAELKLSLQRDIGSGWEDVSGEGAAMTFIAGQDRRFRTMCKMPYYEGIDAGVLPKYRLVAECPTGQVTLHTAEGNEGIPSGQWKSEYEFDGDAPVVTLTGLPDTGQTTQYRVGDDADYGFDATANDDSDGHAGLSYTKLDSSGLELPNNAVSWDFVRDNRSQLIYKMGMGQGTWQNALDAASSYTALGKAWRLPTIKEWVYLADYSKNNDMFDPMVGFIDEGWDPWSSTENINDLTNAWCYETNIGYSDADCNKTDALRHIIFVSGDELVPAFVDNGDGTITDSNSGLMWTKYFLGGDGLTPPVEKNWNSAIDDSLSCSIGGYTDWRLPNIKELVSILDYGIVDPVLPVAFFPQIPSPAKLWSSTTSSLSAANAWVVYVDGGGGFVFYTSKTSSSGLYAIAVRNT